MKRWYITLGVAIVAALASFLWIVLGPGAIFAGGPGVSSARSVQGASERGRDLPRLERLGE